MLLKSPWEGRQRRRRLETWWRRGAGESLEMALSSCLFAKLRLFCFPKPPHTKSSPALFQSYPSVATPGLFPGLFLLRWSWRSLQMRHRLFQVTSWLRNLGDLLRKHVRKNVFLILDLCLTSHWMVLVCQLILIHDRAFFPLLWQHHEVLTVGTEGTWDASGTTVGRLWREWDFGYCEDRKQNVFSGFIPILYVLSLPLCIIVYSFVCVSVCNVL